MNDSVTLRRPGWHLMQSPLAPLFAVAANIILLYAVYSLARVEFLLENYSYFARSISEGRLFHLLAAGLVFDTPGIMYTNALYILLMLIPFNLKENPVWYKGCKWIFIIVNTIALALNLGDSVYFSYTLRRTTTEVFGEFSGEGNLLQILGTEFLSHWYLVVFAVALVWGMWRLYVTPRYLPERGNLVRYYVLSVLSLALAALTVVTGIRGGLLNHWYNYILAFPLSYMAWRLWRSPLWGRNSKVFSVCCAAVAVLLLATAPIGGWRHRDIRPISLSNANAYTSRPTETALVLNTPFAMIRTIGKSEFSDPHYFDNKADLDRIFTPLRIPTVDTTARRRNIVVIIVESFGREYIGALNNEMLGEDYIGYTPFTDSLINHSLTFRYSFCNGRKSIDGMPSVLASIPMFIKPFILTPQALNEVQGLPAHLRNIGYTTAFFHGARTGSMGFDGFANSIGFEHYYGREDFESDRRFGGSADFDGYWAIWDEPFLQYYSAKMSEMKQPFATAVFTASSHHPFHVPDKYRSIYPEEGLPIHKCIRYTDNALKQFFERSKKESWFRNTVFVITSDHTNMSDHDKYKSDIGGFCSPIIIYDPSGEIKPGMRDAVAQQIDIMPTLLGLVGYDRPYVAFGIDLLHTPDNETWAVNYLNGVYQYVRYGYVLQFDGIRTIGLFRLSDHLMKENLAGKVKEQAYMERELKAIIQSYMDRMAADRLTVSSERDILRKSK